MLSPKFLSGATLGACVLLGGCVVSQEKYDALAAQNQQLQTQNQQLTAQNQQMSQQITALNSDVARLQNAIKYTINSDLLFAPGSYRMTPEGQEVIGKFASQLAPTQRQRIMVNGYTDNAPIGASLKQAGITSNEVLSQKRAEAVRDYLISRGVKPDMVGARGFGEAQPLAPNTTREGRAQNRRVELALVGG